MKAIVLILLSFSISISAENLIQQLKLNFREVNQAVYFRDNKLRDLVIQISEKGCAGDFVLNELYFNISLSDKELEKLSQTMAADGSWPDINYNDQSRNRWSPRQHADRLLLMSRAYQDVHSKHYKDPQLSLLIHQGMKAWFVKSPICTNWWYNVVAIPRSMGLAFIYMYDELSVAEKNQAIALMRKQSNSSMTGQNKVWGAGNDLMMAVLMGDESLALKTMNAIVSEINVSELEGVQPDFSFHQHGPQQQFGNYGLAYSNSMAYYANLFSGTTLAFSTEKMNFLRNYFVDGQKWIVWRGNMDWNACGRQFYKEAQRGKALGWSVSLSRMCKADTSHSKIYQSLLDKNFRPTIVGEAAASKHFWRSDLTVFRGKQHYISVRSCSPRVMGTEFVNNENKKGHFLADGNTLIMRRGDEYRDIIPFWDWNKLPGVTAPILENTNQRAGDSYKNKHPFVGGLCAGENGISTFHLDRNAVQARKSYFYLGGKLLCLGNGIQSSTNKEIITGINQSLLKGKVYYAVDKDVITMRDSLIKFEQPQWIWHDSIGYCILSPSRLSISQQRQTGDWHDIMDSYSSEIKSGNVFKLWIDHGKDASLSTSYAYAVLPSVSVADMKSFSQKPSVEVLANTEQVQAIRDVDCKIVELVFHQPVSINSFSKSEFIQSITPGLVMMEKEVRGKIRLTVADPTQFQKEFVLKLSGQYCGEGTEYIEAEKTTLVRLKLPVGGMAGSAVSVSLSRK